MESVERNGMKDFMVKFQELSAENQKYIIAIQQALTFAQSTAIEGEKITPQAQCEQTT